MSWDGTERRKHQRYAVTVRVPADMDFELRDSVTVGTTIPYRQRVHGGSGTGQRIQRKGAGGKVQT